MLKRLEREFAYIESDEAAGCSHVVEMIKKIKAKIGSRHHVVYQRRMETLEARKNLAIYVCFGDDPSSETGCVSTVLIPDSPLVFQFESVEHERATRTVIRRCAKVLGYDIASPTSDILVGYD